MHGWSLYEAAKVKMVFFILLFCNFSVVAQDDPTYALVEIMIPWDCVQTSASDIPTDEEIKIGIDFNSGKIISPRFDAIIKDAESLPFDFFPCLQNFAEKFFQNISSQNGKMKKLPRNFYDNAVSNMEKKINEYSDKSYSKGAFFLLEPGASIFPALTDNDKKSMAKELKNSCGKQSQTSLLLDDSFIRDTLPSVVNEIGLSDNQAGCLRAIAANYSQLLLNSSFSSSQCSSYPEFCEKRNQSIQKTLSILKNIPDLKEYFEDILENINRCPVNIESTNYELNSILALLKITTPCLSMQPGESNRISGNTGSGLDSKYLLTKLPNKNGKPAFRVTLDIVFRKNGIIDFDPSFHTYFKQKAEKCLSEIKDFLKGPNGETLEISLLADSPQEINLPPDFSIHVGSKEVRDSSFEWSPNSDCSTITHEILHHLGLVDEYTETSSGFVVQENGTIRHQEEKAIKPEYDCRINGPKDSIMADPLNAFNKILPGKEILYCECVDLVLPAEIDRPLELGPVGEPSGVAQKNSPEEEKKIRDDLENRAVESEKKCFDTLKGISLQSGLCPQGTRAITKEITYSSWEKSQTPRDELTEAEKFEIDRSQHRRSIRVRDKEVRSSLLYPAQFRAITEPGCSLSNKVYYLCAREAYKTSRASYGKDRCDVGLPKECREGGDAWLR